jgi:tRNA/tmRNA/rRNA uracil-C5-methylase (TrmA/RlmC/RlmD family)
VHLEVGELIELEITKVVHGGAGLGHHHGLAVFVPGVLPGERVVARVRQPKKSFGFADLLDVRDPNPSRVPHIWPEADYSRPPEERAGGADFGHAALAYQRELKKAVLVEAMARQGGIDISELPSLVVEPIDDSADGLRWRTRVTLHVGPNGRAGPYAERSRRVIPVESLPLATEGLECLAAHRDEWTDCDHVSLVDPSAEQPRIIGKPFADITERVFGEEFLLSETSFWQVHHNAANFLSNEVERALQALDIDPAHLHFDLYSGVGLLARALLRQFGQEARLIAVESDSEASQFLAHNLRNFPHSRAVFDDVERFLGEYQQDAPVGVVVLDPPRAGAKETVLRRLADLRPGAIVFFACDPVALGRDTAFLRQCGYRLGEIRAFDFFPHTHHFEAMAVFTSEP